MTYKINGTPFLIEPQSGRWTPRSALGITGDGHPVYPAVREFEITWSALSPTQFYQLQTFFDSVASTGTAVVDLPEYAKSTYAFKSYSGCVLSEPEVGQYFTENYMDARMMVSNIR